MIPIHTERLFLRAFRPDDVDDLVELDSDPAVMEFLGGFPPKTREDAAEWIEFLHRTYSGNRGFWVAEENGRFIGWFHLRPAKDTGETELGYRLRKDAWGRGLATEGGQALIGLAGERVIARTMITNQRSRRVMEKLGMSPVREFLYDDRLPCVEFATNP
ncbi:N-acetyltransferase [bacterium]|nr:MAG: N-acetyltransferase [bacterium]